MREKRIGPSPLKRSWLCRRTTPTGPHRTSKTSAAERRDRQHAGGDQKLVAKASLHLYKALCQRQGRGCANDRGDCRESPARNLKAPLTTPCHNGQGRGCARPRRRALGEAVGLHIKEFIEQRARLVRMLADKVDPFTKARLVKPAEKSDEQLGLGSKLTRHRKIPIGLPQISISASER